MDYELKHYILDENNEPLPCDLLTWAKWFSETDNKRVAWDEFDGYKVSTVFLGLEHGRDVTGRPLLWETMVFKDTWADEDMARPKRTLMRELVTLPWLVSTR